MRKWFRNTLAVLVVTVLVGMAWWALSVPGEPVYDGKRLSAWLKGFDPLAAENISQSDQSVLPNAVLHIGTNAIPMLLNMLQAHDSDITLKLVHLAKKQHFFKFDYVTADRRKYEAMAAFQVLGKQASNAVPELIKIYSNNNSTASQTAILSSLGAIGPPAKSAIPFLLQVVGVNTNPPVRTGGIEALGEIHCEPEVVVPVLTKFLRDPQPFARLFAALGLGNFGTNARPETSGILVLLRDQNTTTRDIALHALGRIYAKPEWDPCEGSETYGSLRRKPGSESQHAIIIRVINDFGAMGTNGAPAVVALIKFLADTDEQVRASATNALKAIDSASAAKAGIK